MSWFYRTFARPALFAQDSEEIHDRTMRALEWASRREVVCDLLSSIYAPPELPVSVQLFSVQRNAPQPYEAQLPATTQLETTAVCDSQKTPPPLRREAFTSQRQRVRCPSQTSDAKVSLRSARSTAFMPSDARACGGGERDMPVQNHAGGSLAGGRGLAETPGVS